MGLFGNTPRAPLRDVSLDGYTPPVIQGGGAPAQRRGLFGNLGRSLTPDRLMILGATLRQLGGREGALNETLGMVQDAQQSQQEQLAAAQQQKLMNDYRERALALQQQRADQAAGGQFEGGAGFTNAYRIDPQTGEVIVGGALPLRPRAPLVGIMSGGDDWTYSDE